MKTNPIMKRKRLVGFLALALTTMFYSACKKPQLDETTKPLPLKAINGPVPITINLEEIYARLPQTVMYNLAGDVHLYLDQAQWRYEQEYVMVRIPVNNAVNKSYIYAVKPYNAPLGPVRSFLVQFLPEQGSTPTDFSGKQMWLNLQDGQVYGVSYVHNAATSFLTAEPTYQYWELSMLNAGLFYLDGSNKIAVYPEPTNPNPVLFTPWIGGDDNTGRDKLFGKGKGESFFGRIFSGIGGFFKGIGGILGDDGGASGPGAWGPGGGGMYGGNDSPYEPPGGNGAIGGSGYQNPPSPPPPPINIWDNAIGSNDWNELGETNNTPIPIVVNSQLLDAAVSSGQQVYNISNPTITYLQSVLGLNTNQANWLGQHLDQASKIQSFLIQYIPDLTLTEKREIALEHLRMLMEHTNYVTKINNLPGHWWDRDQDGFMEARKIQLDIEQEIVPEATVPCNELAKFQTFGQMWQSVNSQQASQAILNRLINIENTYPAFANNGLYVQNINDASGGVVNCDFFPVRILTFPTINGVQMNHATLLEYFRKNINSFISPTINVSFSPYNYGGLNDSPLWNQNNTDALGAIVHIQMVDNGAVILSGYEMTPSSNKFTFSTLKTPFLSDGLHPVSGNRRFGIYTNSNGESTFYTMGVDRITTIAGNFGSAAKDIFSTSGLEDADQLWRSMQSQMIFFINTNGGSAAFYDVNPEIIARTDWSAVQQFLKGQITFQELKTQLGC